MSALLRSQDFIDTIAPKSAVISDDGLYRYRLTRAVEVAEGQRIANFIMLNPSTADAQLDDPTIRRYIGYARDWVCGQLFVSNLFGFRATKPTDMKRAADPIGPENNDYLISAACRAHESGGVVVAAWGALGGLLDQDRKVMLLLTRTLGIPVMCLGTTQDGFPRHPLYLAKDTVPVPFKHPTMKED